MARSNKVIDQLNGLLTTELVAINQYFTHAKLAEHWGFERIASRFRDDSIEEMKDAEALMDRILFLEGLPNLQRLDSFAIGEDVPEQLRLALDLEVKAVAQLHDAIAVCEKENDPGTAEILSEMLLEEQEQVDWLRAQVALVAQLGAPLYLSQQLRS